MNTSEKMYIVIHFWFDAIVNSHSYAVPYITTHTLSTPPQATSAPPQATSTPPQAHRHIAQTLQYLLQTCGVEVEVRDELDDTVFRGVSTVIACRPSSAH